MVHITYLQVDSYILKRWWGISSWEAEAGGSFAFETNLAYKGSSKTARATQRSPVSEKQTNKQTNKTNRQTNKTHSSAIPHACNCFMGLMLLSLCHCCCCVVAEDMASCYCKKEVLNIKSYLFFHHSQISLLFC